MSLTLDKHGKPVIRSQRDYDEYLESLPNRRRKPGLYYDENHSHVSKKEQPKDRAKRAATADALSEMRDIDGQDTPGRYFGDFYSSVAMRRFEDDTNYYSLKDLILANQRANRSVDSNGNIPDLPHDPHNVLQNANLHLTNTQITELLNQNPSDARVYSARTIAFGTALKEAIDAKGWTIKRVKAGGGKGEDLRFTVQSGNNQIDIALFTPVEQHIGNFYVNRNSVYRNGHALAMVHGADALKDTIMPQIEFFMEGLSARKGYKEFSSELLQNSDLQNSTKIRMQGPALKDKRTVLYDHSFNIGHNISVKDNSKETKLTRLRMEIDESRDLTELIENAYALARTSSDENEVDTLVDLDTIRLEDGSIDMDLVDMEVVIRNSNMTTIMRLVKEDALRRIKEGASIDDVRSELVFGREGTSGSTRDVVEFTEDAQNDGFDTDAMDASEDNGAFIQQGARERIANHMVGLTDDSGDPLSGWMDLENSTNKKDYEKVLETSREAAREAGILDFNGRFDNDGVLHWTGNRALARDKDGVVTEKERVTNKIGQFFFPALEDEYDDDGNLIRKKGVLDLKRGNGKQDLRVNNYDVSFVPATENKAHILERMLVTGLHQKLHTSIHTSIKSQFLTRYDDSIVEQEELYDVTRINKAYEGMSRIDLNRMERPGVVEHLRNSFLIDKTYLDREIELKEYAGTDPYYADVYGDPQSARLALKGLEGVYDAHASSDGATLGLRGTFTEDFMTWLDENRDRLKFDETGRLGMLLYDNRSESSLEKWFMGDFGEKDSYKKVTEEIPNLHELDIEALSEDYLQLRSEFQEEFKKKPRDRDKELLENLGNKLDVEFGKIYEGTRNHRYMYASPLVRLMRENYAQYDSVDRVLMTAKMLEVADDVIGGPLDGKGRDRVNVGMVAAGGLPFEDGIPISKEFAERTGLVIGDKLADQHSNKGVVVYIAGVLKPGDVEYNADAEQLFIDAERSGVPIDMFQSPHGSVSRGNMGLLREAMVGYNAKDPDKRDILYTTGPNKGQVRAKVGTISLIVTNMRAADKTNMYEIQQLGRHRTFSYQQALALQSHGASATLKHILGGSERKHADLLQYENVIGIQTTEENRLVRAHYGMKDEHETHVINGVERKLETLDDEKDILLVTNSDVESYGLPKDPAYLQLPVTRNAYLNDTSHDPVQTSYMPLLPERLRRETKTYDGEYVEHDYTAHMLRVVDDFSSKIEEKQMEYLRKYKPGLDEFRTSLNMQHLDDDEMLDHINHLYETSDPEFMKLKAMYPFADRLEALYNDAKVDPAREKLAKGFKEDHNFYTRHVGYLNDEIDKYENAVEKDQFGVDHRSKKRSFTRRRILSQELRNSATAILTSDPTLELDEFGISPALGINSGVLEPIDVEKWEAALATGDPEKIQEAARGNWRPVPGSEGHKLMVWRDPVLHDGSVYAVNFRVDERLAGASIHPAMTATMGADFDGDTIGIAYVSDPAVQKEWSEKLNLRYNLMDARNELAIFNVGADNVEYMNEWILDESDRGFTKEIPWASAKLEEDSNYFKEKTPKAVMFDYISHIEDVTWEKTDARFEELASERGFDANAYDKLISEGGPFIKDELPEEIRTVLDSGEALYNEAHRNVIDDYTYDVVNNLARVTALNERQYRSRYVDISSEESIIESQLEMARMGAKGKEADVLSRNKEYLLKGVTPQQSKDTRLAQKTKVDEIGRSGSQTLQVTPALSSYTFYRGRRAVNGATVGMDVTETASQAILQIKHSPDDVPAALRFLNQSPKLFRGHREGFKDSDETKPVYVTFSSDMLGKTPADRFERIEDFMNGERPGPFEEASGGRDDALGRRIDEMLIRSHIEATSQEHSSPESIGYIYADINMGVVTNKNPNFYHPMNDKVTKYFKDEIRMNWKSELGKDEPVDINGENLYRLSMKTIFKDAGLDISDEEVEFYQKAFREDPNSPRENAGMLRNHDRNTFEHADALDIMAQKGSQGLLEIIEWNKRNEGFPMKLASATYAEPYRVDYKDVIEIVDEAYGSSRENFIKQSERIEKVNEAIDQRFKERGLDKKDEIEVNGKTYVKNDDVLDDDLREQFMKMREKAQATSALEHSETVKETPEAKVAKATPTSSEDPFKKSSVDDEVKTIVRKNEAVIQQALSESKNKDVEYDSTPKATGSYDSNPFQSGI